MGIQTPAAGKEAHLTLSAKVEQHQLKGLC